jgi:hypothetical protein
MAQELELKVIELQKVPSSDSSTSADSTTGLFSINSIISKIGSNGNYQKFTAILLAVWQNYGH